MLRELACHGGILDDRAGNQLWEEGYEKTEIDDVFRSGNFAAIDIEQIGKHREGKEGQSDGDGKLLRFHRCAEQAGDAFQQETVVLEKTKQQQIYNHGGNQGELCKAVFAGSFLSAKL